MIVVVITVQYKQSLGEMYNSLHSPDCVDVQVCARYEQSAPNRSRGPLPDSRCLPDPLTEVNVNHMHGLMISWRVGYYAQVRDKDEWGVSRRHNVVPDDVCEFVPISRSSVVHRWGSRLQVVSFVRSFQCYRRSMSRPPAESSSASACRLQPVRVSCARTMPPRSRHRARSSRVRIKTPWHARAPQAGPCGSDAAGTPTSTHDLGVTPSMVRRSLMTSLASSMRPRASAS